MPYTDCITHFACLPFGTANQIQRFIESTCTSIIFFNAEIPMGNGRTHCLFELNCKYLIRMYSPQDSPCASFSPRFRVYVSQGTHRSGGTSVTRIFNIFLSTKIRNNIPPGRKPSPGTFIMQDLASFARDLRMKCLPGDTPFRRYICH